MSHPSVEITKKPLQQKEEETLREQILKVAKEASRTYITLLAQRKQKDIDHSRNIPEQVDRIQQILDGLEEIKAQLEKHAANAELES